MALVKVGDKETFYYIQRNWIDHNGNPMESYSDCEWNTLEEAIEAAKNPPEGIMVPTDAEVKRKDGLEDDPKYGGITY